MSFKIIADSSSNLRTGEIENFASVPLKIILGNTEYTDNESLDIEALVEAMSTSKEKCSTSCPNVFDWSESFKGADEIFVVTITSSLSGCYSSAERAKEDYIRENPNAKICIIDSLSTGPEMELIIEKLVALRESGATFEDSEAQIFEYMKKTRLLVTLESLKNLAKNGRVSNAVAKIAGVLGIRVIATASEEGCIDTIHKSRGEKKTLETLKEEMLKLGFNGGKLRISHCENSNAAETFKNMILSVFPKSNICIRHCTGLCSFYAERGGMILGFEI